MKFIEKDIEALDRCIDRYITLNSYLICRTLCRTLALECETWTQNERLKKLLYRILESSLDGTFWPLPDYREIDNNRIKALRTMKRAIKLILAGKITYSDLPKSKRVYETDPTNFRLTIAKKPTKRKGKK